MKNYYARCLNILRREFCLKKNQEKNNAEEGDKFKQKPVQ